MSDEGLDALLDFVKRSRGFDFTGYKRTSLERRLRKRMGEVDVATYPEYLEFLEVHPGEFAELFNTILINVTGFFRDARAWEYVDREVLPQLLEPRTGREVRIWSAGCASGEEAYTIAMLLVRHMGEEAFRRHVKIYGTDVDEDALAQARLATYDGKAVQPVPEDLLARCFEPAGAQHAFRKDLRRSLIFGRNDLVQDAPISRIDLLLCRNTLMYFNAETQGRILSRLNFALCDDGYLFLGKSEMLLTRGSLFTPVDLKCRVFARVPRNGTRDRLTFVNGEETAEETPAGPLRDGAFDIAPIAQVAVDRDGALILANQAARGLFGLRAADLGRPLQDLELSYRPVELRSALERVYAERTSARLGTVSWGPPGSAQQRRLEVVAAPIVAGAAELMGATVTFEDVTRHVELREQLERSKRELEAAYEEVQSTNEELETTNEELQSTNEELETTNEELQSTNEELETTNEELQSTNEELETMNDELRDRTLELNELNGFLEAILTSFGDGVVVVDPRLSVQIWSSGAEELWGLRGDEAVGQHLLGLDMGLPVDELRAPLKAALAGQAEDGTIEVAATNRRGRPVRVTVTCMPLTVGDSDVRGAIVVMASREA